MTNTDQSHNLRALLSKYEMENIDINLRRAKRRIKISVALILVGFIVPMYYEYLNRHSFDDDGNFGGIIDIIGFLFIFFGCLAAVMSLFKYFRFLRRRDARRTFSQRQQAGLH